MAFHTEDGTFFNINTLGTSFKDAIVFEWDAWKKKYIIRGEWPMILPTENEELVSRMITLYMLKGTDLFSRMLDWKMIASLNDILINKTKGRLEDASFAVSQLKHNLDAVEVMDRKKVFAADIEMLKEGVEIFDSSFFHYRFKKDRIEAPYSEVVNASVQIAMAVALVSTISYLLSQVCSMLKGTRIPGRMATMNPPERDVRVFRKSPFYTHMKTFIALNKRKSLDSFIDYATINVDISKPSVDIDFFMFSDRGRNGSYTYIPGSDQRIDRRPDDKPAKSDHNILSAIVGQERQVTYIAFITVFYYAYVFHFMTKYINTRFKAVSSYRDNTEYGKTFTDMKDIIPDSFDTFFGLQQVGIQSEVIFQQDMEIEEKKRARKMLSLVMTKMTEEDKAARAEARKRRQQA